MIQKIYAIMLPIDMRVFAFRWYGWDVKLGNLPYYDMEAECIKYANVNVMNAGKQAT